MSLMVLPDKGKQYGFPKRYSENTPLFEWLKLEGYPQELIFEGMLIETWEETWPDNPAECFAI